VKKKINWNNVIFTDEKRFKLDGPDCTKYFWKSLKDKRRMYASQSRNPRASIMFWGGIYKGGKTKLIKCTNKMDSEEYIDMLRDDVIPGVRKKLGKSFTFQQDNASIHGSKMTMDYFQKANISVLPWPAKSPDLNPIENVWALLVQRLYPDGKVYDNLTELEKSAKKVWGQITDKEIIPYIESMDKRVCDVIERKGEWLDY
jgi:transposase